MGPASVAIAAVTKENGNCSAFSSGGSNHDARCSTSVGGGSGYIDGDGSCCSGIRDIAVAVVAAAATAVVVSLYVSAVGPASAAIAVVSMEMVAAAP